LREDADGVELGKGEADLGEAGATAFIEDPEQEVG